MIKKFDICKGNNFGTSKGVPGTPPLCFLYLHAVLGQKVQNNRLPPPLWKSAWPLRKIRDPPLDMGLHNK